MRRWLAACLRRLADWLEPQHIVIAYGADFMQDTARQRAQRAANIISLNDHRKRSPN